MIDFMTVCTKYHPMSRDDLGAPIDLWIHPYIIWSHEVNYTNFVDTGSYDVWICPNCKLKFTIPEPLVLSSNLTSNNKMLILTHTEQEKIVQKKTSQQVRDRWYGANQERGAIKAYLRRRKKIYGEDGFVGDVLNGVLEWISDRDLRYKKKKGGL